MKVKILYRSAVVWNAILFVLFSYVFLYFQHLFITVGTIKDKSALINFANSNISIGVLFLITIFSLIRCLKVGRYFLLFSSAATLLLTIVNLNIEFSKFNIIMLFVYLVISYYIYEFYIFDQKESYYNPLYKRNDLFKPMLTEIPITLMRAEKVVFEGIMTNWSPEGCFIVGDKVANISGTLQVNIPFEGAEFIQAATIVSKAKEMNAFGVRFVENKRKRDKNNLGWKQFYEIIDDMGFKPEFLR